ncbi:hypothetical protein [Paenibacillus sp. S150]|uniref:hypothetical protein n=1 Tax=Paenibacillus sp. S150 TaxID=2749826 RepID=UPI001C5A4C19|nr:hypothetical protein [Paenibacillus sp. S150]MBW4083651.1 hypothetical protein [Paenibacillus sp. S150]
MEEDFHTNESMRKQLLEFLEGTFNYDGTVYLLAVSARESAGDEAALESHWRLRVALTYKENDIVNPYWDGTELDIALAGENIRLLDEVALVNKPPTVEGSPNELALEWVSEIAPPLWMSDEARKAATAMDGDEAARVEERIADQNSEDPFGDYLGK